MVFRARPPSRTSRNPFSEIPAAAALAALTAAAAPGRSAASATVGPPASMAAVLA